MLKQWWNLANYPQKFRKHQTQVYHYNIAVFTDSHTYYDCAKETISTVIGGEKLSKCVSYIKF